MTVEPLQPNESDERPHPAETAPLWNESWYFDFADATRGIGGWVRLGLMPNEDVAWICALVCGPDLPTLAVLDFNAALPADPTKVQTDNIDLTLEPIEPLKKYRVSVRGRGQAHRDPATLLRSNPVDAEEIDLAMDLIWTTAGIPYLYRLTPRYEIPCTVSGTVRWGDSTIELDAVPGQRDHSWGVRDWWGGLEWMWCALHLDDGRHLHIVDARLAGLANTVIGYVQQSDTGLVELEAAEVEEAFADNGLPISSMIRLEPGGVEATVEIGGHAPVRLVSPTGQLSHFPRAWVKVTTSDGGKGVGWIEWNRVQSR
ncbi:hypothetical protein MSAS_51640 [Mycobacterium saskatchewanense]|nr:hypothetical protein [Mycobacterium saskatchewanense]BBX65990.1 hypothetical protein MSAS_51640 [Mycobacterium saskatchewanense]